MINIANKLDSYFEFERYGTTVSVEIIAGVSTYLSLAYIFIVNPAILSTTGISPGAVLFATIVASSVSTFAMGIWARLPFAVAPGLEMNSFFAFIAVKALHMTWQQALGAVFFSGVLCLIFTFLNVRKNIIEAIPDGLKKAIGTSVGVFVATIGLFLAKIVYFNKSGYVDFASFNIHSMYSGAAVILYLGFLISAIFNSRYFRLPGGMLIAIITCAALYPMLVQSGFKSNELSYSNMLSATLKIDYVIALDPRF